MRSATTCDRFFWGLNLLSKLSQLTNDSCVGLCWASHREQIKIANRHQLLLPPHWNQNCTLQKAPRVQFCFQVPYIEDYFLHRYFGDKPALPINQIAAKALLWLIDNHFVIDYPRPTMPNEILIGGLTTRPGNPLPVDLEKFMSQLEHGVVVVSFGSMATNLPEEVRSRLFQAFSKVRSFISNYKISTFPVCHNSDIQWNWNQGPDSSAWDHKIKMLKLQLNRHTFCAAITRPTSDVVNNHSLAENLLFLYCSLTFQSSCHLVSLAVSQGPFWSQIKDCFCMYFQLKYRIIWRYPHTHPSNVPNNVLLLKWMPQQDLLSHPKTKLFITHCGANSQFEALYHTVPMLGIFFLPFSAWGLPNIESVLCTFLCKLHVNAI